MYSTLTCGFCELLGNENQFYIYFSTPTATLTMLSKKMPNYLLFLQTQTAYFYSFMFFLFTLFSPPFPPLNLRTLLAFPFLTKLFFDPI